MSLRSSQNCSRPITTRRSLCSIKTISCCLRPCSLRLPEESLMLDTLSRPRRLSSRINFEQGQIQEIDLANKSVTVKIGNGNGGSSHILKADQLVIALGSVPNFHGIAG